MEFPKDYFEDEVREGFYISGMVKRAWAAQLEVLSDIDRVCKKHKIQYFAEWGTLLGAVRHGGYIPWDDDVDICMKRKDYEAFIKAAKEEMTDWYFLLDFEHYEQSGDFLTRIYNGNRVRLDQPFLDKFHGFPYVAGIDIFPLDYVAPSDYEDEMLCEELRVLVTLADSIEFMERAEREDYLRRLRDIYKIRLDCSKPLRTQLLMLADKLCGTYDEKDSQYLASMAIRTKHDYKIPKDCYADAVLLPFENMQIPVPIGYDEILKIKYRDYMIPVRDGGSHEYPFYKRQEDSIAQRGIFLNKNYQFSKENLQKSDFDKKLTLKTTAGNMMNLLKKVCEDFSRLLEEGDIAQAVGLLEDSQEVAIAFGTHIENLKGEGYVTVKFLEQYCEALYNVHEEILTQVVFDIQQLVNMLENSLADLEFSIQKDLIQKKEAVFIVCKASVWDYAESIWTAARSDPDCDVYVIPIPYYYKDINGNLSEPQFEAEKYPDYVPITDYQTFDFGLHRPDMIFIQNPFDEYNAVTETPPFFYSANLKKFTEQLIYIPSFIVDEIKPCDERALNSMEFFCTMPGVVHADTVIVRSEQMKQSYIDTLTRFAGEETRTIWEKKIFGLGSPKYDTIAAERFGEHVPKEWKRLLYRPDGAKKKVVLYNVCSASLLKYKERMLHKIEDTLQLMNKNKDNVLLLWHVHPLLEEIIKGKNPSLWIQYQKLTEAYKQADWGIYDHTQDFEKLVRMSDAYYGDADQLAQRSVIFGIPVMIQNIQVMEK